MHSSLRITGVSLFGLLLMLAFQNCGDVSVEKLSTDYASQSCVDASADLTIVDTQNIGDLASGSIPAGRRSFQIYRNIANQGLVPFVPQSNTTSWPPQWSRNGQDIEISETYRQLMSDETCQIERIEVQFKACNSSQPIVLSKNFIVGRCNEVKCRLAHSSGLIEARENEDIRFYRSASATCSQACQEVQARCQANGQFQILTAGAENLNLSQLPRQCSAATGCQSEFADPNYCPFPEDPLIRPEGFEAFYRHWGHTFAYDLNPLLSQYAPPYPTGLTQGFPWRTPHTGPLMSFDLVPIGAWTLSRNLASENDSRGKYVSVPFKIGAGHRFNMAFAPAQWITRLNYHGPYLHGRRVGGMRVTISPCRGDFRPSNAGSTDMWLKDCRLDFVQSELSNFGAHAIASESRGCKLEPDKIYWLNFAHTVEMNETGTSIEFNPNITSCEMGSCEMNVRVICDRTADPRCDLSNSGP